MTTTNLQDATDKLQNTQQLNTAIAAGGKIVIEGIYPITHSGFGNRMIDLRSANGVEITGTGPESEIVWDSAVSPANLSQDCYMFETGPNTCDVTIHNIRINGSWDEMVSPILNAQFHIINLIGGNRISLEKLDIYNYLGDAVRCLGGLSLTDLDVRSCRMWHGGRSGISGKGKPARLTFAYNDTSDLLDQGFDWEENDPSNMAIDVRVYGNSFRNGSSAHVFAPVCQGNWHIYDNIIRGRGFIRATGDVVFEGNYIESDDRFTVSGSNGLTVRNNTFLVSNAVSEEGAIYIEKNINRLLFESNKIINNGVGAAVFVQDGRDVIIRNNLIEQVGARSAGAAIKYLFVFDDVARIQIVDNISYNYNYGTLVKSKESWTGLCNYLEVSRNRATTHEEPAPVFDISIQNGTVNQTINENNIGWANATS